MLIVRCEERGGEGRDWSTVSTEMACLVWSVCGVAVWLCGLWKYVYVILRTSLLSSLFRSAVTPQPPHIFNVSEIITIYFLPGYTYNKEWDTDTALSRV